MKITTDNIQPFLAQFELPDDPYERIAVLEMLDRIITDLIYQIRLEL